MARTFLMGASMRHHATRLPLASFFVSLVLCGAAATAHAQAIDDDGDGVPDDADSCTACYNPLQTDADGDGLGDCWRCDWCDGPGTDMDWDGLCDEWDNCALDWNQSQSDADGDGVGDLCDADPATAEPSAPVVVDAGPALADEPAEACVDDDGDGHCGADDNCAGCYNPVQLDADGDGLGDCWRCDWCDGGGTDTDWDGTCDDADNCPLVWNHSQSDGDRDSLGDACDAEPSVPSAPARCFDGDGDGHCDDDDNCPTAWNQSQQDSDADGVGDACDATIETDRGTCVDADADRVCDDRDNCAGCWNPEQEDPDGDGLGQCWRCDWCDGPGSDTDWDTHCDANDNCPNTWNTSQLDTDGDGLGDGCDPQPNVATSDEACADADFDDVCDREDNCPTAWNGSQADADGDGVGDACDVAAPAPSSPVTVDCNETWTRYPADRTHSPVTCAITENLRRIAAIEPQRRGDVFMKVGDSISATHEFMTCFETEAFSFDATGHGALEGAHAWFLDGDAGGTSPYARSSLATLSSRTADWALQGTPPPVEQELWAVNPRYALVMFGTNDMGYGGHTASAAVKFPWMYENLLELVDWIADRGVVPVMYSIPPYAGLYDEQRYLMESWNVVVRAMAEGRQLPFVDYYREMLALPGYGLRSDGVHPNADYLSLCNFDDETGLIWGYNLRNLLSMEALDRVWRVTDPAASRDAWDDAGAPPLAGSGAASSPRVVDTLPFAEMTDLRDSSHSDLVHYASCGTSLSGAETVYRVSLSAPTPMRVMALHSSSVDADIVWLSSPSEGGCVRSDDVMLRGTFPAGTHYFAVDAASSSTEGDVVFLAAPCDVADVRCSAAP